MALLNVFIYTCGASGHVLLIFSSQRLVNAGLPWTGLPWPGLPWPGLHYLFFHIQLFDIHSLARLYMISTIVPGNTMS